VKATLFLANGTRVEIPDVSAAVEAEIRTLAEVIHERPEVVIEQGDDRVIVPAGQLRRVVLHDGKYAVLDVR
jgi:hypothetical protein